MPRGAGLWPRSPTSKQCAECHKGALGCNIAEVCNFGTFDGVGEELGLRDRKKAATRIALSEAAARLAMERGIELVTADMIASEAGVSVRTFHNYFSCKEELFCTTRADVLEWADWLRERPGDEPILDSLEHIVREGSARVRPRTREDAGARRPHRLEAPLFWPEDGDARAPAPMLDEVIAERTGATGLYPSLLQTVVGAAVKASLDLWMSVGRRPPAPSNSSTRRSTTCAPASPYPPARPAPDQKEPSMATYLYRIGRFAYRRKGTVLSIWLAILVLMGVGAATLSGPTNDSFSIPGTPAQKAQDLMAERFPASAKDPFSSISARYVFAAPEGETLESPENQPRWMPPLARSAASTSSTRPPRSTRPPHLPRQLRVRWSTGGRRCQPDPDGDGAGRAGGTPSTLRWRTRRRCPR